MSGAIAAAVIGAAIWQLGARDYQAAILIGFFGSIALAGIVLEEVVFGRTTASFSRVRFAVGVLAAAALLLLTLGSFGVSGHYATPGVGWFLLGMGLVSGVVAVAVHRSRPRQRARRTP